MLHFLCDDKHNFVITKFIITEILHPKCKWL